MTVAGRRDRQPCLSIIAYYKCLLQMKPLEDSNERLIVFGRPTGTQERLWTMEGY